MVNPLSDGRWPLPIYQTLGPVAECIYAGARCNRLYPGSTPGRASNLARAGVGFSVALEKRRARTDPGSSAFDFRLSLIGVSFPTAASEFRKRGFKHEVTSMFVALVGQCTAPLNVPLGTRMRLLTRGRKGELVGRKRIA